MLEGYYTTGGWEQVVGHSENATRSWWRVCEPGYYCTGGIKRQCPGGRYGSNSSVFSPACTGPCAGGYFCPPGSTSPTAYKCGDVFANSSAAFLDTLRGEAITYGLDAIPQVPASYLVPWEAGYRVRRPINAVHITSVAAIDTLGLNGGPTSVFCPAVRGAPAQ